MAADPRSGYLSAVTGNCDLSYILSRAHTRLSLFRLRDDHGRIARYSALCMDMSSRFVRLGDWPATAAAADIAGSVQPVADHHPGGLPHRSPLGFSARHRLPLRLPRRDQPSQRLRLATEQSV